MLRAPILGRIIKAAEDRPAPGDVMESRSEVVQRWRYLRDLLIDQLSRFESGVMKMHSDNVDVSAGAIVKLKQNIIDFDTLIHRSEMRDED